MYNGQFTAVNRFTPISQREPPHSHTSMAQSSGSTHRPYQAAAPKPRAVATFPDSSTSSAPSVPADRMERVAISNLMSPPEQTRHDNFSSRDSAAFVSLAAPHAQAGGSKGSKKLLISPPDSPEDVAENDLSTASGSAQDPILFPEPSPAAPAVPLFALEAEQERQHQEELGRLDSYMLERSQLLYPSSSVPTREEYQVFIDFKFYMMKHYLRDPRSWLKMQRESLDRDATAARLKQRRPTPVVSNPASRYTAILPAKRSHHATGGEIHVSSSKVSRLDRSNRVTKPAADRSVAVAGPSKRRPSSSGGPRANSSIPADTPSAEPQKRTTSRDDKDFGSLPDYCPPLSSLPDRPNRLKVDWKGAPIDLSNDPDRDLLHPDELGLASTLRLDCATYLTSKRRIFIRLAENSGKGRAFRKTDAQQACHIDVNKASKLWTAYDKVGWLNVNWVRQFMKPPTGD